MIAKLKALRQHQGFMRYFQNTSWLMGEKILRMFMGLFVGIWVARYLGPEQFGLLSYVQSFVFLFTTIATLGLDGIVVRELVKDESKRDKLLGTAFGLKLIGALLILPVLALAVHFSNNNQQTNLLIFIIASTTIFQSFNVIDFYFQSKVLSRYVAIANTISLLISSLVKIALIINQAPLITFAGIILFDNFILAMGFVYFYLKKVARISKWKYDFKMAKSLLKDSWPLILSSVVISIYMKIDQIMIKEMLNTAAVGQYAAAVRLSEAWYFIPMVIASSLFPAIINAKKHSETQYYARLQKLYDLMVWMAIIIALPTTFLSDWVVNILYGEQYHQAIDVLVIHVWAGMFVGLGVARGRWILNENLQNYSFLYLSIGMLVNIIFNYRFIPTLGINGAAYATVLSQFIGTIISPLFFKKTRVSFYMMVNSILLLPSILRGK